MFEWDKHKWFKIKQTKILSNGTNKNVLKQIIPKRFEWKQPDVIPNKKEFWNK